jgi:hypothetical protein
MEPNGNREPPDIGSFNQNRVQFPLSELLPYLGKTVAWTPDGTRIVAAGDDEETVCSRLKAEGKEPSSFVLEYLPRLDEDTWL